MTERAKQATPHLPHPHHLPAQRSSGPTETAAKRRTADQPAAEPVGSVRTKPIRRSVDLSPAHHARLTQWCADAAEEIGATRVTGQDVIRALVARLLADQALSRRIRADLKINM